MDRQTTTVSDSARVTRPGLVATARSTRLAREESGQVLVLFVLFLVVLVGFAALVIDVGDWFGTKRMAQGAADAGALAAAQELCGDAQTAITTGEEYVARNIDPATATVVTPYNGNDNLVEVKVDAPANTYFAGVFGIDSVNVGARAVAGGECASITQPLAIMVHEMCGNKGFKVNGESALIQGGIHVNGDFEIDGDDFEAELHTTVYRPPPQGTSPQNAPGPQSSGCKTVYENDSVFCSQCEGGPTNGPVDGPWRDWVTPYHTEAIMKSFTPCEHTWNNDRKFEDSIPDGVHCLPSNRKFTLAGDIGSPGNPARITVIGGEIELVTDSSYLEPVNPEHPVLFYSTNTSGDPVKMNPSEDHEWVGWIINRNGGVESDAGGVTSPFQGLIEARWITVNGDDFAMLGTFPDTVESTEVHDVTLEE